MAINPKKLLEELSQQAQIQMNKLEAEIDRYVEVNFEGRSVCVPVSEYPKAHVAEKLKEKYLGAGWTSARFRSDQRDGEYFELEYNPLVKGASHARYD